MTISTHVLGGYAAARYSAVHASARPRVRGRPRVRVASRKE